MSGQPGLFLDRDGVINHFRVESVLSLDQFSYYPFTSEAMKGLGQLGWPIVVVTNQSAIGRGWTDQARVDQIHQQLCQDSLSWGAPIASVEYCPHLPDAGCRCRKPGPEMFERAALSHGIDLERSVMIGDSPCDIEAANNIGMMAIHVGTGRGGVPLDPALEVAAEVADLGEASEWIVNHEGLK